MAETRLKKDPNFVSIAGAVTESGGETRPLLVDDTTGYLLIDATLNFTGVQDAEAVSAADYGTLILGTDGSNYQVVATNSSGRLQVDVLSITGVASTEYTEGDTDTTITGTAMLMEGASSTLLPIQGTVADGLLVNLGANNDVTLASTTITGTVAVIQSGTWDEVGINDSGNAITVDWAGTAPPIGAGLEATALRVTVATDSTGVLSVDDNSSSLTVDNAGLTELAAAINASSQMDVNIAASGATVPVS